MARSRAASPTTLLAVAAVLLLTAAAGAQTLVGDCDRNGTVEKREVIRAIQMALGRRNGTGCAALDANADGRTGIAEVLRAVSLTQTVSIPSVVGRYEGSGQTVNQCSDPSYDSINPIAVVVVSIDEQEGAAFRGEVFEPAKEGAIGLQGHVAANGDLSGSFAFRAAPPRPLRAAHHLFTYQGAFTGRARDGSLGLELDGTYEAETLECRIRMTVATERLAP
jgi:hypothetical protein